MQWNLTGRTRDAQHRRSASGFLSVTRLMSHLLWPTFCPVCGKLGEHICDACMLDLIRQLPAVCVECGGTSPCPLHPNAPLCFGVTRYDSVNRRIIHSMKYRHAKGVARAMGAAMARSFEIPKVDCLVPVPLHKKSERDYNQAAEIARSAGGVWGIPVVDMLRWSLDTTRQAAKHTADERNLPEGAIIPKQGCKRGLKVFLVDDVYTTGSTLRSATRAAEAVGCSVAGAMVWSFS